MGEYAEMMLDGTCCHICGEYLGGDDGYPVACPSCQDDLQPAPPVHGRTKCSICGKRVKKVGLADHKRDVHAIAKAEDKA